MNCPYIFMLQIDQKILDEIYAESERCHPFEGCGFILGTDGNGRVATRFVAVKNIQNDVHAKDPVRYPRDAKTAYTIDPKDMQKIELDAKAKGEKIINIFHSHPEHGVYFSQEDKDMAAPWGEPLFPSISYLVTSVYAGKLVNCSEFYWSDEKTDFVERKIK